MVKIARPDRHKRAAGNTSVADDRSSKTQSEISENTTETDQELIEEDSTPAENNTDAKSVAHRKNINSEDGEEERPEKISLSKGLFQKKNKAVIKKPKRDIGQTVKYAIIGLVGLVLIGWIMAPSEGDKIKQAEVAERKEQRAAAKEKEYQDALAEQAAKEQELKEFEAAREKARLQREEEAKRFAAEREKAKAARAAEIAKLKEQQECRQLRAAAERDAAKKAAKDEIAAKAARTAAEEVDLGPTQEELAAMTREERVAAIKAERIRKSELRAQRRAEAVAEQARRKNEREEREEALQTDGDCDHLRIGSQEPTTSESETSVTVKAADDAAGKSVPQPVEAQ